jgi:glycosyltransferase involved in cell wall biosynthesis
VTASNSPDTRPLILYVIQAADYSGAETSQVPLLRADPDPLLACPAGSRTEQLASSLGVSTVDLPFRSLRHSAGRRQLLRSVLDGLRSARDLRAIERAHPERRLIYATSLRPGMLAAVAGIGLRGRRVVWVMPDFLPPPPLRMVVRMLALISGARVVALSQVLADEFSGRWRGLRDRVVVVNPGIEVDRFASVRTSRPPRAGVFGHISPTKQTALALDIAELVGRERPDFGLDIIGAAQYREEDFDYERALRQRIAADPWLSVSVRMRGYSNDVAEALSGLSMLLHCREDEPFGMVLIEAMAAGLPVVAPAAAGPAEIVEHGRTGLLYAPGDARAAAEHVLALLGDPDRARAMGIAARESALERFSAAGQLRKLERLLANLAA